MITKIITAKGGEFALVGQGKVRPVETLYGLSSDIKPLVGVENGDRFLEMDTGRLYLYDETGQRWLIL